jgi:hypothetical protein
VDTDEVAEPRARNSLIVFLVLTFALSSIFYIRSFSGAPLGQVAPLLMWMPGVAAIVTQLLFFRTPKGLGWHPGSWRYLAMAVLIPIFYCLVIYVPVWLAGVGLFDGAISRRCSLSCRSRSSKAWSRRSAKRSAGAAFSRRPCIGCVGS